MKSTFMIEEPKKIDATMKTTMTIEAWENLRNQLREVGNVYSTFPTNVFIAQINDLLLQARKVFYPTIEEKEREA